MDRDTRKTGLIVPLIIALFLTTMFQATADRGGISFLPNVLIREPSQKAILAWNGNEQITILTTDMSVSKPTQVLQVMPFPAEPKIDRAEVAIFSEISSLTRQLMIENALYSSGLRGGATESGLPGEVTFHERIGSHELFTIRADRTEGFVSWVEERLRSYGMDDPRIPDILRTSVEEYIREGYRWFVFDVVDLTTSLNSLEAISYRFTSGHLFYPIRISRTNHGFTDILLYVFSPWSAAFPQGASGNYTHQRETPDLEKLEEALKNYLQDDRGRQKSLRGPAYKAPLLFEGLSPREMDIRPVPGFKREMLSRTSMPELEELFAPGTPVYLDLWNITGDIREIDKDVIVSVTEEKAK